MAKRDIIEELMDGVAAMKNDREGKIILRTHRIEQARLPKANAKESRTRENR